MANRICLRPQAKADLLAIWRYIADDNEAAADRLLDNLESLFAILASRPMSGRARSGLSIGLRSFVSGNHVIFYQPTSDGVEIVRVLSRYLDISEEDFD